MHQTWPTAWSVCDVKTLLSVFLFHTSAQLVQTSTHLKRPRPTAKARVFCSLHEEVCTIQHFTFHACYWKRAPENTFFRIYLGL